MRRRNRAFTLLELMTVVVIISVLAATAIPSFSRYMKKSKVTEVYLQLRKIYDGELAYYNDEHVSSAGVTLTKVFIPTFVVPAWPPTIDKKLGDFSGGNWPQIHYSADSPLQYCYWADAYPFPSPYPWRPTGYDVTTDPGFDPTGIITAFQVTAMGDTDGDGTYSQFQRNGGVFVGKPDFEAREVIFADNELE